MILFLVFSVDRNNYWSSTQYPNVDNYNNTYNVNFNNGYVENNDKNNANYSFAVLHLFYLYFHVCNYRIHFVGGFFFVIVVIPKHKYNLCKCFISLVNVNIKLSYRIVVTFFIHATKYMFFLKYIKYNVFTTIYMHKHTHIGVPGFDYVKRCI